MLVQKEEFSERTLPIVLPLFDSIHCAVSHTNWPAWPDMYLQQTDLYKYHHGLRNSVYI